MFALSKLIGHQVKIDLMPALGVNSYMPECQFKGLDAVFIEIEGSYGHGEFVPLMRVLSIRHGQTCRTSSGAQRNSGDYCQGP